MDDDPRQDERVALLGQVRRDAHHALAGEVAPGLLQRVDERVCGRHARGVVAVLQVARADPAAVLLQDRLEEANALIALPDRGGRVFSEHDRDGAVRGVLRDDRHQSRR